jgi:hypothetical protein
MLSVLRLAFDEISLSTAINSNRIAVTAMLAVTALACYIATKKRSTYHDYVQKQRPDVKWWSYLSFVLPILLTIVYAVQEAL